jgi:hypothetical protein
MDTVVVFEWFGQIRAAEQAHEPRQREIWTRWVVLGARRGSLPSRGAGMIGEDALLSISAADGPRAAAGSREPKSLPRDPMVGSYYCG